MSSPSVLRSDSLPPPLAILHGSIVRFANQSFLCKLCSVALTSATLFLATWHGGGTAVSIAWLAAPVALLGFVDAAGVAEARRLAKLARSLSAKDRSDPDKLAEVIATLANGPGYPMILTRLFGVISLSIWPFYLGLFGMMAAILHRNMAAEAKDSAAKSQIDAQAYTQLGHLKNFPTPPSGATRPFGSNPLGPRLTAPPSSSTFPSNVSRVPASVGGPDHRPVTPGTGATIPFRNGGTPRQMTVPTPTAPAPNVTVPDAESPASLNPAPAAFTHPSTLQPQMSKP